MPDIPFSPTFLCTGNNAGLKGDTLRRVFPLRLEATEDPRRTRWIHDPQPARVRPGTPGGTCNCRVDDPAGVHRRGSTGPGSEAEPMGGFEAWSGLVRRATHWAVGHDPCATKSEAKSADKLATRLPTLIEGWARLCQSCGAAASPPRKRSRRSRLIRRTTRPCTPS